MKCKREEKVKIRVQIQVQVTASDVLRRISNLIFAFYDYPQIGKLI